VINSVSGGGRAGCLIGCGLQAALIGADRFADLYLTVMCNSCL
jgi:hypothetical protein